MLNQTNNWNSTLYVTLILQAKKELFFFPTVDIEEEKRMLSPLDKVEK